MASVFVTKTRQPTDEELEIEPYAYITFGGVYFFLYDAILELRNCTGELIDPQTDSFFDRGTLGQLAEFLQECMRRALREPNDWEQRVGRLSTGEPVHERTSRAAVLDLLRRLDRAVTFAREHERGVFLMGE